MKKTILLSLGLCLTTGLFAQQFSDATSWIPVSETMPLTMDAEFLDVDNDNDLDLILACEFTPNLLLFNNGSGQFSIDPARTFPKVRFYPPHPYIFGEDSEDIAIADFNQDNLPDVLFVSEDTPYHEFYFGLGNGNFSLAPNQIPRTAKANAVLAFDANGDNLTDILLGHTGANILYLNLGGGQFAPDSLNIMPTNSEHTQDLKLVDIDNDGDDDIVEGVELGGSNIYIKHNGVYIEESFRFPIGIESFETRKIEFADVNNDGYEDLFLCNVSWRQNAIPKSLLLINDGQGHFLDESAVRFPYFFAFTLDARFLDLNDDGAVDLITAGDGDVFQPKAFLNDTANPGHFIQDHNTFPDLFQDRIIAMAAGDVNGDNQTDIYLGSTPDRMVIQGSLTGVKNLEQEDQVKAWFNALDSQLYIESLPENAANLTLFDQLGRTFQQLEISPASKKMAIPIAEQHRHQVALMKITDQHGQIIYTNQLYLN